MSAAPSLTQLMEVIRALDQGAQAAPLDQTLQAAAATLQRAIPGARSVRIYHLADQLVSLRATDAQVPSSLAAELTEQQQSAIEQRAPIQHDNTWTVPLHVHDEVVGLLEIDADPEQPLPVEWLSLAGYHLARALVKDTDETRLLYEISRSILGAQDTLDVLRALRTHMAADAVSITHTVIGYDAKGRIQTVTVDALNTPVGEQVVAFAMDEAIGPDNREALNAYWNGKPYSIMFIEDVNAPEEFPLAEFLRSTGTGSYIAMPIREGGLVREAIAISFAEPQHFDAQQRRLYTALSEQVSIVLQNHRLLREAQLSAAQLSKQVSILETINRLASVMAETQDEQTLLDASAEALTRTVGVDHCGILMLNPALTSGTVVSEYPAHGAVGTHFDIPDNLLEPIIQNSDARPILIENTEADPSLKEGSKTVLRDLGVNSLLIIPMFVHGRCIGSAGLDIYREGRSFTPEMVEMARTITAQVVIGLQNIRLFNDAHRRAEQLQRITAFGQSVEATLDLAAIFESMLAESARMLPQDQISVSLYDVPSGKLRVVAEHVGGKTSIDLNGGDSVPITGRIATVWNNWELLHIDDVPVEAGAPTTSSIRSWILVPLLSRGRILGIVSVGCVRPYAYSETDVALFQQMVNQFAVAIENAQAFAQSQRMARNESLVNEISSQIQRQMDIQRMMDVTVNQLGKALGARRARIRLGVRPPNGEQE